MAQKRASKKKVRKPVNTAKSSYRVMPGVDKAHPPVFHIVFKKNIDWDIHNICFSQKEAEIYVARQKDKDRFKIVREEMPLWLWEMGDEKKRDRTFAVDDKKLEKVMKDTRKANAKIDKE